MVSTIMKDNSIEVNKVFNENDVVFTGIQELGRSFGRHLSYYVYALKISELPGLVSPTSFVHTIANKVFQVTGIPTAGYVENAPEISVNERPFLIATRPLHIGGGNVTVTYNESEFDIGIYETETKTSAVNLYLRGHKFATQTLWSRILQNTIENTKGLSYEYDAIKHGIMVKISENLIRDYLPNWADTATKEAAVDCLNVDEDTLQRLMLRKTDIPIFRPFRYVDLDPRVGMDGTAYALSPVRTKMECPPELNLHFLQPRLTPKILQEWYRSHNRVMLQFRIQWGPFRLKPNAVHLDVLLDEASDEEIEKCKAFFRDQAINVSKDLSSLIDGSRKHGLARVTPHYLSSDYGRMTYIVPTKLLIPNITQENWHLFAKTISIEGGNEGFSRLYYSLTKFRSETLACLNSAVANTLSSELRPRLLWDGGEKVIEFVKGPLSFPSNQESILNFAGFQILKGVLPKVTIMERDTGLLRNVSPGDLYDIAKGEIFSEDRLQIISKPQTFSKKLRVAIIHPEYRGNSLTHSLIGSNRGPRICEAVVTGNLDLIDPERTKRSQESGNTHPLKNSDSVLNHMYDFFGYEPSRVTVKEYYVEDKTLDKDGNPTGFIDKMREALQVGTDLFIVFLPNTKYKALRERVYYATYAFGFQHNKPVIHYRPGTWKGFSETYSLAYSYLAHATKRFGGSIYRTDTADLWARVKLPPEYQSVSNPLCVYVDSGQWANHGSVGLITATGLDFSQSICHITMTARRETDLFNNIDHTLKHMIVSGNHDLLLTMRDSYFRRAELMRVNDVADQVGVPTLAVSTVKSGGLSAWKFRKGYGRNTLGVTAPYGTALLTPDDTAEIFPHNIELENEDAGGLWRSIRLNKEQAYPATIRVDQDWLAQLGLYLSSTADYMADPSRMKYPSFLAKATKLFDFILNGVFDEMQTNVNRDTGTIQTFDAGLID